MLFAEAEFLLHQLVLTGKGGREHGGIVGVQRDHQTFVEIALDGMLGDRRAYAGLQIAGHANLDRNLPLGEFLDQVGILVRGQSVADALGTQVQRAPDRFRTGGLARVCGQTQPVFGAIRIYFAEQLRTGLALVAADPESHHVSILILDRQFGDPLRFSGSELPHRIEDPQQRHAEIARALGSRPRSRPSKIAAKFCFRYRHTPDRDVDLGVKHILCLEPLHHAIRDEFVVCRSLSDAR